MVNETDAKDVEEPIEEPEVWGMEDAKKPDAEPLTAEVKDVEEPIEEPEDF